MGFTLPEKAQWVNGFCGPFSLDMFMLLKVYLCSAVFLLPEVQAVRPATSSVKQMMCINLDAGSWMGFTLPEKAQWVNGFCGPFSLDMFRRQWMAQSAV